MPYPVPPPEPPAIINQLPSVSTQESFVTREQLITDGQPVTGHNQILPLQDDAGTGVAEAEREKFDPISPLANSSSDPSLLDGNTPRLPKQELLPEPSSTVKSAAMLGEPLSLTVSGETASKSITTSQIFSDRDRQNTELAADAAVSAIDQMLASGKSNHSASSAIKEKDQEITYSTLRDRELSRDSVGEWTVGADLSPAPALQRDVLSDSLFPGREGVRSSEFTNSVSQVPTNQRQRDTLPQLEPSFPTLVKEIAPTGHIGPTIGPIQIQTQTQRQPSQGNQAQSNQTPGSTGTPDLGSTIVGVVELASDRQEYDAIRQIFLGEGNVSLRYQGGLIEADRIQGNLVNRIAVAEGRVAFRRGQQALRGQRLVYNLLQDRGNITNGRGEIFAPTSGSDLGFNLPNTGLVPPLVAERPLSDRLLEDQPAQQITNPGELNLLFGGTRPGSGLPPFGRGGQVNRIRFEAENIEFYPRGWTANNVRLTNDPFSPPELEIRADRAVLTQVSPLREEVVLKRPRLVFDQGLSIPILRSRYVFDRSPSDPPIVVFGYDAEERGGVFAERTFNIYTSQRVRFRITPQFFIQRAITQGFGNPGELFGVRSRFDAAIGPRTTLGVAAVVNNFGIQDIDEKVRASMRLVQIIGTKLPHRLTLEYSYRDRLFNGSLGYQTVQQSLGAVLTSPPITLGKTGAILSYQAGAQYINADTDRLDLLEPIRDNNRTNLSRFQLSASLFRPILLWRGRPLPATPTEGLRYTPVPVVPNIRLVPSLTGTTSLYSSGDSQNSLTGSVALFGQFGHFSRSFLDYTGFNIRYTQVLNNGLSPFFFDRLVDERVLSFGITQQIYGPIRIGFQTAINLDTKQSISTDYFVEYSRRTYGVTLRYNPDLQLGAILFRVSDFNWSNGGQPFGGTGVRFIDTGILQDY